MKNILKFFVLFCAFFISFNCLMSEELESEDGIYNEVSDNDIAVLPVILTKPTFSLNANAYTSLLISINYNDSAVKGYQIYRATSKKGKYTKVYTISTNGKEFNTIINYVNYKLKFNKTYYYKVRSFGTNEKGKTIYSAYSSILSRKVAVGKVSAIGRSTTFLRNTISWSRVSGASGYAVYKVVNGKYILLKNTTALSYTDSFKDSVTSLNIESTYKVAAYRKVSGKKYFGSSSNAINVKSVLNVPTIKYTDIDSTSFRYETNMVSGANAYEVIKCIDLTCEDENPTIVNSSDTITTESMANLYYYKVRAVRKINEEVIYSDYSKVYTFSSLPKKVNVSHDYEVHYGILNKNTTLILMANTNENIKFNLYRSTSKTGTYTLINESSSCGYAKDVFAGTETESSLTDEDKFMYVCNDKTVLPGKTYYYKIVTVMNENDIEYNSYYSDVITMKMVPSKVANVQKSPYTYNSSYILWDKIDYAEGYEVYRSTSKSGKYTKIKTTANIIVADTGLTIGKTYYYKVRAYFKDAKGNKIYGSFSNTISRKVVSLTSLNKFPAELTSVNNASIIKSASFTKKSTIGSSVIYKFKINYTKTWASYKMNVYYVIYFYDALGNKVKTYTIYHKNYPAGTKKNYSITVEVKLPKNAVYWEFE